MMNYCNNCGDTVKLGTPPGDDRPRYLCESCGTIHYENPKVVVGCIPQMDGKILLCRRAIEPRSGKWTLPALRRVLDAKHSKKPGPVLKF
jgi:hypothetical protein